MNKGFYIESEETSKYGISFAMLYNTKEKDFHINIMICNINIKIGYIF